MGMWHMSCALSGLTLFNEDVKVGLVFLSTGLDHKSGSITLNHDSRLSMVTPPLWGEYDGSGAVVVADGREADHAMRWLERVVPKAKSLKDVQDACYEERVKIGKKKFLYYCMVREDVWRVMVQQGEALKPDWRRQVGLALKKLSSIEMFEEDEEDEEEDEEVEMLMILILSGLYGFKVPTTMSHKEGRWGKNKKEDVTEEEINVVADVIYVQHLMSNLRLEWTTGTGGGRQDTNHALRKAWFDSMSALCMIEDS